MEAQIMKVTKLQWAVILMALIFSFFFGMEVYNNFKPKKNTTSTNTQPKQTAALGTY